MLKRTIFSIACALVLTICSLPLFSNIDFGALAANKNGRIDIHARGNAHSGIEILEKESCPLSYTAPNWCKNENGTCVSIDWHLSKRYKDCVIKFIAHDATSIEFFFMGPNKEKNDIRVPIPIDYKRISINGVEKKHSRVTAWQDKVFSQTIDVKNGDIVTLSFKARRHGRRISDLHHIYGGSYLIEISLFLILFVVAFRLSGLMRNRGNNANRIFVVILAALMLVPVLHISKAEKSQTENRMLAQKPHLVNGNGVNLKYGTQYDSWFNDRFLGRDILLNVHMWTQKHLNRYLRNAQAVMDTRTKWCFLQWGAYQSPDAQTVLDGLAALNRFAHDNGAKFYVLIVPDKTDVYRQAHPFLRIFPEAVHGDAIKYIMQHADFPVVFPLAELRQAAQSDFVFFKTEHHWTEYGAFVGYRALMRQIKKDFHQLHVVSEDDYDTFRDKRVRGDWGRQFGMGQTYNTLHVKMPEHKVLDVDYKYYTPRAQLNYNITNIPQYKIKHYSNPHGKKRVILTGTSMNENLLQFLPYSFRDIKYYRLNNVSDVKDENIFKVLTRYGTDFKKYHPDIIILVITSHNMPYLKDIMK